MEFPTEDEAKGYAVDLTARHLNAEEILNRVEDYNSYLALSKGERREYWQKEIHNLEEWIGSEEYLNGEYPRGIDELFLELIEWRAAIFAFQNVETEIDPFKQHAFYSQWLVGGTYTMFCLLGKLVSKNSKDNSLRKLWNVVFKYVANSGLCGVGEVAHINEKLHPKDGQFTNLNSQAMKYRNKVIAHNECLPKMEWSELDKDIKLICRVWSLITMWSSFGLMEPFRSPEQVFSGTEALFSQKEISQLQSQREVYLTKVKSWCSNCLLSGKQIVDRVPFGKLSVSIRSHGVTNNNNGAKD